MSLTASLEVHQDGGATIAFSDVGEGEKPVEWRMKFARNGSLLKASKVPAPLYQGYWYLHPASAEGQSKPVPVDTLKAVRYVPTANSGVATSAGVASPAGTTVPVPPSAQ